MVPEGGRAQDRLGRGASMLAALSLVLLVSGCITSEVITITDIALEGPVPVPPVRVTIDSIAPGFVFSPRLTGSAVQEVTGTVGGKSYYATPGSNELVWVIPTLAYGLDMDINLTDNFAISAGVTVAQGDRDTYVAGRFGLGVFGVKDGLGGRLDAGLILSGLDYAAKTTVKSTVEYWWSGSDAYLTYFADRGATSHPGIYVQLSINSAIRDFPVNFFVSGGVTWRDLAGFTPVRFDTSVASNDNYPAGGEASESAVLFNVTPGLSIDLWGRSRLLLGGRMILTDIDNQSPWPVWMPFIQLDLAL